MILSELFNTKIPLRIIADDERQLDVEGRINGRTVEFIANCSSYKIDNKTDWTIEFAQAGSYQLTGSGGEFEVFAFVGQCIEHLVKKRSPDTIRFTSDKVDGETRTNLYKRMTKLIKGYTTHVIDDGSRQVKFRLEKK